MRDLVILFVHVIVTLSRLWWPGSTMRREYLDRILFWTTADLENKLLDFRDYLNLHRTHTSLQGRPPDQDANESRPFADLHSYRWQSHCQGLYQTPVAA
jgi:hypothetical protein